MTLDDWIGQERAHAAAMMRESISCRIVKQRPGFAQAIRPRRGSIVASPVPGNYDPDPDYFFHWYRDSALVADALRFVPDGEREFRDFVYFSLALNNLDGRAVPLSSPSPGFERFLRDDLDAVHGQAVIADTRVNPDGTLDVSRWPRPQHDGAALRALALLNWKLDFPECIALLRADLAYVLAHADRPGYDIWEEELGVHYYALRVSAAALQKGAAWLAAHGDAETAAHCRARAEELSHKLAGYWSQEQGFIRSRPGPQKQLDVSVILAANHAAAVPDEKLKATLEKLASLFGESYAINAARPAPALGRYAGDTYYGGNPWYLATLAAAELHYRAGDRTAGDRFLETVRAFTPLSGDLSEQFAAATGAPVSALHLAWSYAAFLTAIAARDQASEQTPAATSRTAPPPG